MLFNINKYRSHTLFFCIPYKFIECVCSPHNFEAEFQLLILYIIIVLISIVEFVKYDITTTTLVESSNEAITKISSLYVHGNSGRIKEAKDIAR